MMITGRNREYMIIVEMLGGGDFCAYLSFSALSEDITERLAKAAGEAMICALKEGSKLRIVPLYATEGASYWAAPCRINRLSGGHQDFLIRIESRESEDLYACFSCPRGEAAPKLANNAAYGMRAAYGSRGTKAVVTPIKDEGPLCLTV